MNMETIILKSVSITNEKYSSHRISFQKAELMVVSQYGDRLWYIDVEGVNDGALLAWFGQSEQIKVEVRATTGTDEVWEGTGYFHPNEPHSAAAIRGEGELIRL